MSYPYLSDVINHIFGTHWSIPIATFGSFVALAVIVAVFIAKKEVVRYESLSLLPKAKKSPNVFIPTHEVITDLAVVTSLFGILGARVFHILEYPQDFLENPMSMIFSREGLSIYGGLIFGFIAGILYLRKREVPITPMLDALAPAMIVGYGVGRIGCQISGDGDWGAAADMALKPNWVPNWFWAQTYENNIVGAVIPAPGVYPTPIYESLTAFGIFLFLWAIRKNSYRQGYIFSIYLLLSGFGRLLIEKIRINSYYHVAGASFTQAELISFVLILFGLLGIVKLTKLNYVFKVGFGCMVLGGLTACVRL